MLQHFPIVISIVTITIRLILIQNTIAAPYGKAYSYQSPAYGSNNCADNCANTANGGYDDQPHLQYGYRNTGSGNGYSSYATNVEAYSNYQQSINPSGGNYGTFQISLPLNTRFPAQINLPYSNARLALIPNNSSVTTVIGAVPTIVTTATVNNNNNNYDYTDLTNVPSHYCNDTKRAGFRRHAPTNVNTVRLPLVLPILYGAFHSQGNRLAMYPSVVLVIDENAKTRERRFITVDTGLSHLKDSVVSALQAHSVEPSMIDTVVITHPDTDTMGNLNLFPCAQIFASNRISKENLFVERAPPIFNNSRSELPYHGLFDNTELYLTPGYGIQDQSLIIRNVENHGTVAIVGKLIFNQTELIGATDMAISEFAGDDGAGDQRKLWLAARREIVCLADYVIPGHGVPFKIGAKLKRIAECSRSDGKTVKRHL